MTQSFSPFIRSLRRYRAFGLACIMLATTGAYAGERIDVLLDKALVMSIPASVKTMVLGNPAIADITLLKRGGKMVVTGKSFGETNLVALDADGNLLLETVIRVSAAGGTLVVQRGMDRATYACHPRCERTISLGDDPDFMSTAISQAGARTGAAKGSER